MEGSILFPRKFLSFYKIQTKTAFWKTQCSQDIFKDHLNTLLISWLWATDMYQMFNHKCLAYHFEGSWNAHFNSFLGKLSTFLKGPKQTLWNCSLNVILETIRNRLVWKESGSAQEKQQLKKLKRRERMKKLSGILNSLMAKLRSIHYYATHMIMGKRRKQQFSDWVLFSHHTHIPHLLVQSWEKFPNYAIGCFTGYKK